MARTGRFVKPETVRLHLTDGDWIEVKKYLTTKEQRRIDSYGMERMVKQTKAGEATAEDEVEVKFDWVRWQINRVLSYIVDWNFVRVVGEEEGKPKVEPVEFSRDALESLDPESFDEIEQAITAHVEAMAEEKKARKAKSLTLSTPGETTGEPAESAPNPT